MTSTQRTCFVISPIGPDGSEVREAANDFLELLVEPSLEKYGFSVTRADRIAHPTAITTDIVRLVQESDLCLIDLTNSNPNVFYECGRRHETGKPFIQMIKKGLEGSLPFDVAGIRTVIYDVSSPRAARESVLKLQEFIDSMVAAGFKTVTSGDSLSSIAQGIERLERKMNQILSAPTLAVSEAGAGGEQEEDTIADLMKSPREAFMSAIRKGRLDKALAMLDRLKKILAPDEYAASLTLLVSTGHGKSFERLDGEVTELLRKPGDVKDSAELMQLLSQGAQNYFVNTGQSLEGLKYLEDLYAKVGAMAQFDEKTKAFVANKVGMIAWSNHNLDLCVKYTKLATSLSEDASYYYNLALAYEAKDLDQELHDTLKHLSHMPELDVDHRKFLGRYGYQHQT